MISVEEVTEEKLWEDFLATRGFPLLQSWAWGIFQEALGKKIFRLGVFENKKLICSGLFISERSKTVNFLYSPEGPSLSLGGNAQDLFLGKVREIASNQKASFIRLDPRKNFDTRSFQGLTKGGFIQPECTALLDLSLEEGELLKKLSSSTRYNIGMSSRRGVKVREAAPFEIDTFASLLDATAEKKGLLLPREPDYHKRQFLVLKKAGLMRLYVAEYERKILAGALVAFYGKTAYYLHAANSYQHPALRASYPLVWHTVLEAKKRGFSKFDFWGVAPEGEENHPWSGVTNFKLSFGSERVCYAAPFDLPLRSNYRLIRIKETLRNPLRKVLRFGKRLKG